MESYTDFANCRENQIMVRFLTRDIDLGFKDNALAAIDEVQLLNDCTSINDYIRNTRFGYCVALTRAKRKSIWGMWENAQDHAGFEVWKKELMSS